MGQLVAARVEIGCPMRSLKPLVHTTCESVNAVLLNVYWIDAKCVKTVAYDESVVLVGNSGDVANFLPASVGPGGVVDGDEGCVIVDVFFPFLERDNAVIVSVKQPDLVSASAFLLEVPDVDVGWKVEVADDDVALGLVPYAACESCEPGRNVWNTCNLTQ